jgi:hypothetical protein
MPDMTPNVYPVAPPLYSSQVAPVPQTPVSPAFFFVLLAVLGVGGLAIFLLAGGWDDFVSPWVSTQRDKLRKTTVVRQRVALLASAKDLQTDLIRLARRGDTDSPEGLSKILQETSLALLRHPDKVVYAWSSTEQAKTVERNPQKTPHQLVREEKRNWPSALTKYNHENKSAKITFHSNGSVSSGAWVDTYLKMHGRDFNYKHVKEESFVDKSGNKHTITPNFNNGKVMSHTIEISPVAKVDSQGLPKPSKVTNDERNIRRAMDRRSLALMKQISKELNKDEGSLEVLKELSKRQKTDEKFTALRSRAVEIVKGLRTQQKKKTDL